MCALNSKYLNKRVLWAQEATWAHGLFLGICYMWEEGGVSGPGTLTELQWEPIRCIKTKAFAPEAISSTETASGRIPSSTPLGPQIFPVVLRKESKVQNRPLPMLQGKYCIMATHFWKLKRTLIYPTKSQRILYCCGEFPSAHSSIHTPPLLSSPSDANCLWRWAYTWMHRCVQRWISQVPKSQNNTHHVPILIFKSTQTKSSLLSGRKENG